MSIFIGIIVFIVGLGVVICLHEAGHFSMAKLFKVYCEEFSIGFGPRIISINPKDKTTGKKRWETTLNIRLLPLGGYVAMVGEEDDSAMTEAGSAPIPKERTFSGINRGKQAVIMIAGIVMNIILSYFLFLFGNAFGKQQDPYSNKVKLLDGSHLAASGISTGDEVDGMILDLGSLDIEDGKISSTSDLAIVDGTGKEADYSSIQDILSLPVNSTLRAIGDTSSILESYPDLDGAYSVADSFNFYSVQSALSIGIFGQDENGNLYNVKADGTPMTSEDDSSLALRFAPRSSESHMVVTLDYTHGDSAKIGQASIPTASTEVAEDDGTTSTELSFGALGISVYMSYMPDPDSGKSGSDTITGEVFGKAIVQSFVDQGEGIRDVYVALGSLFTPSGWNNVGGIVSIFMTNQQAVDLGFYYVMWVWGLISVNLAVLNLLPIPGLDGWQLLLCIIEAIRRKPVSSKFKSYASVIGLSCLLVLALVLVVLDCIRYFA